MTLEEFAIERDDVDGFEAGVGDGEIALPREAVMEVVEPLEADLAGVLFWRPVFVNEDLVVGADEVGAIDEAGAGELDFLPRRDDIRRRQVFAAVEDFIGLRVDDENDGQDTLVAVFTQPFELLYQLRFGLGLSPAVEDTFRIAPLPCAFIGGTSSRANR